jgi:beta-glucanase (GH16 family)
MDPLTMRRRLVVAAVMLATLSLAGCQSGQPSAAVAPAPPLPAGHPPGSWHLVFQDDFSGRSLDLAHWSAGWLARGITVPVQPEDLECYDPAQVIVSRGKLDLALMRKPEACGGQTRPYASGLVNTSGKFSVRYGFLEARIWLPGNRQIANWPAFWAAGAHWPEDGEIDVLEGLHGRACWHFVNATDVRGNCTGGQFAGSWHTYGADWEPGSITYYYDGQVMGTIRNGITSTPMYLILNNATAPQTGGPILAPATMQVAYVLVWQHGP